jgi:leucyl-tRNA synthetase
MLSCFAPFTAEEAWQRLGRAASVCDYGWPEADAALAAAETVTCVVQVDGCHLPGAWDQGVATT